MLPRRALLIAIIACSATLAGCGKKEPETGMTFNMGDGTLATRSDGSVVFKDDDGASATVNGGGAVELPKGVDVYPGATVSNHMVMDMSPGRRSFMVSGSTSDSINQVLDHYRAVAKAGGFTIDKDEMDSASSTISARKPDGSANFGLLVKPAAPNTDFQISASELKK